MTSRSDWLTGVTLNTWDTYTNDLAIDGQLVIRNRIFLDKQLSGTAASPAIALGDGDTGWYESADDVMWATVAGSNRFSFSTSSINSATSGGPRINYAASSSTTPSLIPSNTDTNTGIGSNGADQGSLIAGGNEKYRFTKDGGSITAVVYEGSVVTNEDEIVFT